ncbi:GNAT family N-acetyltransferase [Streptomyces sp. col6]|uniref:GNAT family N-acetyltransferase n=1 Tax=Streptomyces sp. col6 TaxID=2478958 RepID=UPI001CD09EE4|nr:GNAT family N-acetyltransferase [Streptomyces sp. col6]
MRTPVVLRPLTGSELLARHEDARQVYAEAFGGPPWSEDASAADGFIRRLSDDVAHPGFTAVGAFRDDRLVGLATAWTTPTPLPSGRCYPRAAAALGPGRTAQWLCGSREVDELAVSADARGQGVGAALLERVTADAPDGRCWLLTSVRARDAMSFYRRLGWAQATHPACENTGIAVFLGPRHPGRTAVPLPL